MIVAQTLRRERKRTITPRATENTSVERTAPTAARQGSRRSETVLILMSDGIEACSTGIIALMRSTVAMTLAPGKRWIVRMIARCLLYQAAIRLFSGPLIAFPTSLTRTGDPLRYAMIKSP